MELCFEKLAILAIWFYDMINSTLQGTSPSHYDELYIKGYSFEKLAILAIWFYDMINSTLHGTSPSHYDKLHSKGS